SSAASVLEPEAASVTATSSSSEPRTTSVARVAGWPVDAVAAVGAPAVATRVAELVDAQQRHAAEGRLIADLLYEPIGREPDRNARRALLDWRRAAFQDRPVRRPLDASTLAALDRRGAVAHASGNRAGRAERHRGGAAVESCAAAPAGTAQSVVPCGRRRVPVRGPAPLGCGVGTTAGPDTRHQMRPGPGGRG